MNVVARTPWTEAQFLDWAERQDSRFEFDGSQPVAMTGGSKNHDLITANIAIALRRRLRGGPCSNHGPNLGVRTVGATIRYPDALVTCTAFAGTDRLAPDPVVVVEVSSPASGRDDRIVKVLEYAAVASIRYYVIVGSDSPGLTVLHRTQGAADWSVRTLTAGDSLTLAAIGVDIPVDELYEDVVFAGAATA